MLPFFNLFRNSLYEKGILKVHKIPGAFVVSVGNLSMGGTGKTPLVLELLEAFIGLPVALLTRGYKGGYQKKELPLVVQTSTTADLVGDEPLLIKRAFPETLVIVDPDRVRGGLFAKEMGATVLLLDDGMQHRRIGRDIEIVVVDGENPFPRWRLRESKKELKRADFVIVMGGDFTPSQPYVRMRKKFVGAFDVRTDKPVDLHEKEVGLFCGVGNPLQVVKTAIEGGAVVKQRWFLSDHEKPILEKLHDFATLCENVGASLLLCTEKDRIKLPSPLPFALQAAYLKIGLEVLEGIDIWRDLLNRCRRAAK